MPTRTLAAGALAAFCTLAAAHLSAHAADLVPVKIGVLNDRSGVYFDSTGEGAVVAARMAVEDFKPEQHGLKVEVIAADHQNKPDVGASIARQWYDRDGVDAIFDVPTSSVALAIAQITKEKNKAFVNSGGGTADLTGPACTPNTVHWTYDTAALANGTGKALLKRGGKSWYFITADYAFGLALERDTKAVVEKNGGKVVGGVRTPFPNPDFSSFLLQAQASGAQVIGLADAGLDAANAIKQAHEFGIRQGGSSSPPADRHHRHPFARPRRGPGAPVHRLVLLGPERRHPFLRRPLRAEDAGQEADLLSGGRLCQHAPLPEGRRGPALGQGRRGGGRQDEGDPHRRPALRQGDDPAGRAQDPPDVPVRGEGSAESKGEWDLYKVLETIPADQAFRPMSEGGCR